MHLNGAKTIGGGERLSLYNYIQKSIEASIVAGGAVEVIFGAGDYVLTNGVIVDVIEFLFVEVVGVDMLYVVIVEPELVACDSLVDG